MRFYCQNCGWSFVDNVTSAAVQRCPDCGGGVFTTQPFQKTYGAQVSTVTGTVMGTPVERPKPFRPHVVTDDNEV